MHSLSFLRSMTLGARGPLNLNESVNVSSLIERDNYAQPSLLRARILRNQYEKNTMRNGKRKDGRYRY